MKNKRNGTVELHQPVRHHIIQISSIYVLFYCIVCVFGRFLEMWFLHDSMLYGMKEEILEIIFKHTLRVQFLVHLFFSSFFFILLLCIKIQSCPKMVVLWVCIWVWRTGTLHTGIFPSDQSRSLILSLAKSRSTSFFINHKIKSSKKQNWQSNNNSKLLVHLTLHQRFYFVLNAYTEQKTMPYGKKQIKMKIMIACFASVRKRYHKT